MKNKIISLALVCVMLIFSITYQTPAIGAKDLEGSIKTMEEATTTEETSSTETSTTEASSTEATTEEIQGSTNPSKTSLVSLTNLSGKKLKVIWNVNTTGTGYQIQIATNKKFSGKFTHNISKNTVRGIVFTELKKKKTYYVRIRTVSKVDGKTYYSKWSSKKHKKITK